MSRTFIEMLDDMQALHDELENKAIEESNANRVQFDTVEVVRCKDCKYMLNTGKYEFDPQHIIPDIMCIRQTYGKYVTIDDYCSYGERK